MDDNAFPIRDYDHLTVGDLHHRVRSLSADELGRVLDHERAHGNRTAVLEILTARRTELENGAEPSDGDQQNVPAGETAQTPREVTPAHTPDPTTPLRHGVASQTPSRGRS